MKQTPRPPAPPLTPAEREVVERFEAAPVLAEAWHEHRWIDVTRIGDGGDLRFICTIEGCDAVNRVPR